MGDIPLVSFLIHVSHFYFKKNIHILYQNYCSRVVTREIFAHTEVFAHVTDGEQFTPFNNSLPRHATIEVILFHDGCYKTISLDDFIFPHWVYDAKEQIVFFNFQFSIKIIKSLDFSRILKSIFESFKIFMLNYFKT